MKTPIDDFTFKYEIRNNDIIVEAVHNTLSTTFVRRYSWADKIIVDKNQCLIDTTLKVVKDIIQASIHSIAHPLIKSQDSYTILKVEWDKEKEAWFILDEDNNRKYD